MIRRINAFWLCAVAIVAGGLVLTEVLHNDYYFNALYVILQGTLMAVAWNILGGFTGYVNFGSAGFFAVGAYTSIFFDKYFGQPLPLPVRGKTFTASMPFCKHPLLPARQLMRKTCSARWISACAAARTDWYGRNWRRNSTCFLKKNACGERK